MDYNPILPDIQKIIQKHAHLLRSSPELLEIFPSKSIFLAYRTRGYGRLVESGVLEVSSFAQNLTKSCSISPHEIISFTTNMFPSFYSLYILTYLEFFTVQSQSISCFVRRRSDQNAVI